MYFKKISTLRSNAILEMPCNASADLSTAGPANTRFVSINGIDAMTIILIKFYL